MYDVRSRQDEAGMSVNWNTTTRARMKQNDAYKRGYISALFLVSKRRIAPNTETITAVH